MENILYRAMRSFFPSLLNRRHLYLTGSICMVSSVLLPVSVAGVPATNQTFRTSIYAASKKKIAEHYIFFGFSAVLGVLVLYTAYSRFNKKKAGKNKPLKLKSVHGPVGTDEPTDEKRYQLSLKRLEGGPNKITDISTESITQRALERRTLYDYISDKVSTENGEVVYQVAVAYGSEDETTFLQQAAFKDCQTNQYIAAYLEKDKLDEKICIYIKIASPGDSYHTIDVYYNENHVELYLKGTQNFWEELKKNEGYKDLTPQEKYLYVGIEPPVKETDKSKRKPKDFYHWRRKKACCVAQLIIDTGISLKDVKEKHTVLYVTITDSQTIKVRRWFYVADKPYKKHRTVLLTDKVEEVFYGVKGVYLWKDNPAVKYDPKEFLIKKDNPQYFYKLPQGATPSTLEDWLKAVSYSKSITETDRLRFYIEVSREEEAQLNQKKG